MIGACVERLLTLTPAREPRKPQLHELSHVTCNCHYGDGSASQAPLRTSPGWGWWMLCGWTNDDTCPGTAPCD